MLLHRERQERAEDMAADGGVGGMVDRPGAHDRLGPADEVLDLEEIEVAQDRLKGGSMAPRFSSKVAPQNSPVWRVWAISRFGDRRFQNAPAAEYARIRTAVDRAPFVAGVDELEEEIAAARRDGEVADLVDDEQGEAAVVADPVARGAVAFSPGRRAS